MSRARESSMLTGRAFRVHFRSDADPARGVFTGRVEHLRSGDASHFTSLQDLVAFVEFWLTRQHDGSVERRGASG